MAKVLADFLLFAEDEATEYEIFRSSLPLLEVEEVIEELRLVERGPNPDAHRILNCDFVLNRKLFLVKYVEYELEDLLLEAVVVSR